MKKKITALMLSVIGIILIAGSALGAYVDFTTWTEVDPATYQDVGANYVIWEDVTRAVDTYVYKDLDILRQTLSLILN